jgi:CBS domain-containing protein
MRAKDVMTTDVVSVSPEMPVAEVAQLLLSRNISGVPVVDAEGRVLGVVSEGDLMRRPELESERHRSWWLRLLSTSAENAADYVRAHGLTAGEVMTRSVVAVTENTELGEIAQLLEERRIKRVPVLRDGKLVGIVSRANLLQGLVAHSKKGVAPPTADDRSIREQVMRAIVAQGWVGYGALNAIVDDGVVELWGWVDTDEERRAMLLAAERIPGVRKVIDHLGFVPPYLRDS